MMQWQRSLLASVAQPFDPSRNSNTVAWFDMSDYSTMSISGSDVLDVSNKITSSSIELAHLRLNPPQTGGVFNGHPAVQFDIGRMLELGPMPRSGVVNYFMVCREDDPTQSGLFSWLGNDNQNTAIPIARANAGGSYIRINGVDDPEDVEVYLDGDVLPFSGNRADMYTQIITEGKDNLLVATGCAAPNVDILSLGDQVSGFAGYELVGPCACLVVVTGVMTAGELQQMRDYLLERYAP